MNEHGYNYHIGNHVYHDCTGVRQTANILLAGKDGAIWNKSLSNEFDRLSQGVKKSDL